MNKVKADIITAFARKMTTLLSLTKSQSEQLLSFWKTMIVFIHPSSTEIVKRVKASYTSCIRQTLREEEERKRLVQQHMDECSYFSRNRLSVDKKRARLFMFCSFHF